MSARAYAYSMLILKIFFFVLGVKHKINVSTTLIIIKLNTVTKVRKL